MSFHTTCIGLGTPLCPRPYNTRSSKRNTLVDIRGEVEWRAAEFATQAANLIDEIKQSREKGQRNMNKLQQESDAMQAKIENAHRKRVSKGSICGQERIPRAR